MNTPQTSRLAGGSTPRSAGDTTAQPPTCPTCSRPWPQIEVCECGHLDVFHALAGDNQTRKACSHHEGPKATPCGCRSYSPRTSVLETPR